MLAGVLLPLCLAPVTGIARTPWLVTPIVLTWLVLSRLAPRYAVPAALVVTLAIVGWTVRGDDSISAGSLVPHLEATMPTFSWAAMIGIAVPLYIVTMASQNVPGVAVMSSFGFQIPWRAAMTTTGLGTVLGAAAGGHAINLAAISAALAASPDADPEPGRRWIAANTAGWVYLVLGGLSAGLATLVAAAPQGIVEAAAGLALLGTFGAALGNAMSSAVGRESAVATFLVAASGVSFGGIGAAFWALVVGLLVRLVLTRSSHPGAGRHAAGRSGTAG